MELQEATYYLKPLKMFLYGPSYSGKTYSALELATGIVMRMRKCDKTEAYKHVLLYDTEYRRGTLYRNLGAFKYYDEKPPYSSDKLAQNIRDINLMDDIDVVIIDSFTHYWSKQGGILEQKSIKDKAGGNSYTNWLDYTNIFNKVIDVILESPKHFIVTSRAKSDVVLAENDRGKMAPKTLGLKPDMRDGIDFEFDMVFNIDKDTHNLITDKAIPGMEMLYSLATADLGMEFYDLFTAEATKPERTDEDIAINIRNLAQQHAMIVDVQLKLSGRKLTELTHDELLNLETELITAIKKKQTKK